MLDRPGAVIIGGRLDFSAKSAGKRTVFFPSASTPAISSY